jgi:Fe2+ or Zn2+ uptake regulation protein
LKEGLDLRKTKQRKKLLDFFRTTNKPMTADQILKHCHIECPNMALTTVYRNLDKLIDMGYVSKSIYPDGAARYTAADIGHRHIVTCRMCHAQVELPNCPIQGCEEMISNQTGYKVEHHYLEFFGICPSCLKSDLAFQRNNVEVPGVQQSSEYDEEEEDEFHTEINKLLAEEPSIENEAENEEESEEDSIK